MNPILMAVILVVVIAIICSVMLVIASTVMAVPEDPKFPAIRECLPGANCGACGYAGCDGYAKALASGEATIAMLQESNAYAMIADGEPITIVWPEEGAAASTRVAAICKSTDQPDIAKAFVEFLLDPEVQQELIDTGDEAYFTPSVEGVTAKPDREPNPTLVAADVQFGAENEADIKAWFADYSAQ